MNQVVSRRGILALGAAGVLAATTTSPSGPRSTAPAPTTDPAGSAPPAAPPWSLDSTWVDSVGSGTRGVEPPSWASAQKVFDLETGTYNLDATTLARFRSARDGAVAGASTGLHISVIGDSQSHLADYNGPQSRDTWSARMRDTLSSSLGLPSGGSGIVPMWQEAFVDDTDGHPPWEPRLVYRAGVGGHLRQVRGWGASGANAVEILSDASNGNEVVFTPGVACDEIWITMLGNGYRSRVVVASGATTHQFEIAAYVGEVFAPEPGWTAVPCESGYVRTSTPESTGGLRVAVLRLPKRLEWSASIRSLNAQDPTILISVEARDTTNTSGLRVSNLAEGGRSMRDIFTATNELAGYGGMPIVVDAANADLAVIAIGINDWLAHRPVAAYKAELKTLVARQRQSTPTGTDGFGTGVSGDVLLWIQPQPNYEAMPLDHVQVPFLTDYFRAIYEVADEEDCALFDHAYRWTDYGTSAHMYRDDIHPNRIGHADIGLAVGAALASV
jgi:lysophospholipase L1-like esterase